MSDIGVSISVAYIDMHSIAIRMNIIFNQEFLICRAMNRKENNKSILDSAEC